MKQRAAGFLSFPPFCRLVSVFWSVLRRPTPASPASSREEPSICVPGAKPTAASSTLTRKVGCRGKTERLLPCHQTQESGFPSPSRSWSLSVLQDIMVALLTALLKSWDRFVPCGETDRKSGRRSRRLRLNLFDLQVKRAAAPCLPSPF